MAFRYLFVLLVISNNLSYSTSIWCHKTTDSKKEDATNNSNRCKGDYCVKQIIYLGGTNVMVQYGCVSGFDVSPGCIRDSRNASVCYCNDGDLCNTKDDYNQSVTVLNEIECYDGVVIDGKVIGNKTRRGETCYLTGMISDSGKKVDIMAGCINGYSIPTDIYGKECVYVQTVQRGKDEWWNCHCKTKLCNNPSSVKIPTKTGSTKCVLEAGVFNASNNETNILLKDTCIGEYCSFVEYRNGYNKGCYSLKGKKLKKKTVSFEFVDMLEIHLCDIDMCNQNISTILQSYEVSNVKADEKILNSTFINMLF